MPQRTAHIKTAFVLFSIFFSVITVSAQLYQEPFRPQFHFTPERNWMNDPNGLVYYDGEYHLFYQHNPFENFWGHMSWGHAVSKDMIRWRHLPVAIPEEGDEMIFSGSVVVDWKNTTGFGINNKPPMVAIYTGHYSSKRKEVQSLAYSNDRGRTWTKYHANPVLDIDKSDFRDPKVIWHQSTNKWIMVVALANERKIQFYSSPDLKSWTLLQTFDPQIQRGEVVECPDFYSLPVDNNPAKHKWVLTFSQKELHYILGDFDGNMFKAITSNRTRIDFGFDHYALQSFSDIPKNDGRRISMAWMHNFAYEFPTTPWKCQMTFPLSVELKTINNEVVLVQNPVRELASLRQTKYSFCRKKLHEIQLELGKIKGPLLEINVTFNPANSSKTGFRICKGKDEVTTVFYDNKKNELVVDRSKSGNTGFDSDFFPISVAPLKPMANRLVNMHILIDKSSVEVIGNEGQTVQTNLIYPSDASTGIEIFSEDGEPENVKLEIWNLKSIYTK